MFVSLRWCALVQSIGAELSRAGSYQLSQLGLSVVFVRLTLETVEGSTRWQLIAALRAALDVGRSVLEFVELLLPQDMDLFWLPCTSLVAFSLTSLTHHNVAVSSYHISNAAALLLRTAVWSTTLDAALRKSAFDLISRLVTVLMAAHHAANWFVSLLRVTFRSLTPGLPPQGRRFTRLGSYRNTTSKCREAAARGLVSYAAVWSTQSRYRRERSQPQHRYDGRRLAVRIRPAVVDVNGYQSATGWLRRHDEWGTSVSPTVFGVALTIASALRTAHRSVWRKRRRF